MWDPEHYLLYASERSRPFFDLLAQVPFLQAKQIVDLGCGPGNLTLQLARRFPGAEVLAIDQDPRMLASARELGLKTQQLDLRQWQPTSELDLILSNAVLHWLPEHPVLLVQWLQALKAGAWLAFQVPANFDQPSHCLPAELAQSPRWQAELAGLLEPEPEPVLSLDAYEQLLAPWSDRLNLWQTTYLHRLQGRDPVLDWLSGSRLRPIKAQLTEEAWLDFCAELAPALRAAYPERHGYSRLPFRRIFVVAERHRQPDSDLHC